MSLARSTDVRSREFVLRSDVLPSLIGHLSSTDESIAEMAAGVVAELCSDRRCRDELLRQDAVQKLLRMVSSSRNDNLRAKAVHAIGGMCGDDRFWDVITRSNGLTMLVEILFNPNSTGTIKLGVCNAVADLVVDRNHALAFQRAGGAHALTSCVGVQDKDTAAAAAFALGNLAKAIDAANVQIDDTTIRRLVQMLAEPGASSGMHAIAVLCDHEPTRQRFIQSGVEAGLANASKCHADMTARQLGVQVLVKVLKEGNDGGQRLVQLGGVGMLMGMASSGRVEDKEAALEQLEQISSNQGGLSSLEGQERDLLPTLVQSMQSNLSAVRIRAISVLANVTRDERIAPFAVGAGAVAAMLQHHDRKRVEELDGVVNVLRNLSWLDSLHDLIIEASFLPNLVSLLVSSRTQTQEAAAIVLADLSTRQHLLPHLVAGGALPNVVQLLSRGNASLVERAMKTLSNMVCIPDAARELQASGRIDVIVPHLSMGSQNTQMSAVLAIGAIVSAVGERQRYLQTGAVERIAALIVAGQMRHDGLLYALGELCEDAGVCEVLGGMEQPWAPCRSWLIKSVQAAFSDLDLRQRCAFVLRRIAKVPNESVKAALVNGGAMSAAMHLLQQQEDATLCADLSGMMYDLALCRRGLDMICMPQSLCVIVNLSHHTHEPTRACCIRLLGLVMARGGVKEIIQSGGDEAICIIGMLAATLTINVAAVSTARHELGSLGPFVSERSTTPEVYQAATVGHPYGQASHDQKPLQGTVIDAVVEASPPAQQQVIAVPTSSHVVQAESIDTDVRNAAGDSAAAYAQPPPAQSRHMNSHVSPDISAPCAAKTHVGPPIDSPPVMFSALPKASLPCDSASPPLVSPAGLQDGVPAPRLEQPPPISVLDMPSAPGATPVKPLASPTADCSAFASRSGALEATLSEAQQDVSDLEHLLQQFKLRDALVALREYGVGCVDDLRELEPKELDQLAVAPLTRKKLLKLLLHLDVAAFSATQVCPLPHHTNTQC